MLEGRVEFRSRDVGVASVRQMGTKARLGGGDVITLRAT